MGRRTADSWEQGRQRVAELKAIAGNGSLDERCANLARYFERIYFGPPPRDSARPERVHNVSIRPQKPRRRLRRLNPQRKRVHPAGWWRRCEKCQRYLGRDGLCNHCDKPVEVSH